MPELPSAAEPVCPFSAEDEFCYNDITLDATFLDANLSTYLSVIYQPTSDVDRVCPLLDDAWDDCLNTVVTAAETKKKRLPHL